MKDQDIETLSKSVDVAAYPVNEKGQEGAKDSGAGFAMVFAIAFLIYITVLLYGQVVLGAVVEEKETRIAEILFSSIRPFQLMLGKLIGVSLMALTQLSIWVGAFGLLAAFLLPRLAESGYEHIFTAHSAHLFCLLLSFLFRWLFHLRFHLCSGWVNGDDDAGGRTDGDANCVYSNGGLYMAFPIIGAPNSNFAFWISMVPFFAPITMMVRIVSQTPPFWQIAVCHS